jgi:glycosyltransferase involved in cell wall biosynthesis
MAGGQKILFVSHKADRSGAPILLLHIIREFKKNTTIPFHILLMEDGVLAKDFKKLGKTFIWNKKPGAGSSNSISRIILRIGMVLHGSYTLFQLRGTSLVFMNTITNGYMHKKLLFLKCRFITYVHEMEAAIRMLTDECSLGIAARHSDFFLADSNAVKENLVVNHQFKSNSIQVVATPMPANDLKKDKALYAAFKSKLNIKNSIPQNAVIIGITASNDWRKGFDLFSPLVKLYFQLFPDSNAYFIWKGLRTGEFYSFLDHFDYKKSGIEGRALLVEHGADSLEYMACYDIHLLLSREDPYPLVVLDAASFGIPTICFSDAGGSPEFVENDAGCIIPYGDLFTMANQINYLAGNSSVRAQMGLCAQSKLAARHGQNAIDRIIDILKSNSLLSNQ